MYLAVADDGRVLSHAHFPGSAEMAAMHTHASSTFCAMEADRQVAAAIKLGKVPNYVVSDDGYAAFDHRDRRYSVFEFAVTETVFGVFVGADNHVDAKAAALDVMDRVKAGEGRRETVLSVVGYPADFDHDEVFEHVAGGFWKVRPDREDLIVIRSIILRMADFEEADEAEAIAREGDDDAYLARAESGYADA